MPESASGDESDDDDDGQLEDLNIGVLEIEILKQLKDAKFIEGIE